MPARTMGEGFGNGFCSLIVTRFKASSGKKRGFRPSGYRVFYEVRNGTHLDTINAFKVSADILSL